MDGRCTGSGINKQGLLESPASLMAPSIYALADHVGGLGRRVVNRLGQIDAFLLGLPLPGRRAGLLLRSNRTMRPTHAGTRRGGGPPHHGSEALDQHT